MARVSDFFFFFFLFFSKESKSLFERMKVRADRLV